MMLEDRWGRMVIRNYSKQAAWLLHGRPGPIGEGKRAVYTTRAPTSAVPRKVD